MNEQQDKLSSLLDDFSESLECQETLDEVLRDVNQRNCLNRYQMIGQVMRHELPDQMNTDFVSQVMSEINQIDSVETKPTLSTQSEKSGSFWESVFFKPIAGLAVAATVAVISVTLWQSVSVTPGSTTLNNSELASAEQQVDQQKIQQLANQPIQGGAVSVVSSSLKKGTRWTVIKDAPGLEKKLNAYLVNHTEYSKSMQGLIPQARVAGFDSKQSDK